MQRVVVVTWWRQSAALGEVGSLRRQMQGIRAAWKRKYLHGGLGSDREGSLWFGGPYRAYHAPRRLCSLRSQKSLMLVIVAFASARHFS